MKDTDLHAFRDVFQAMAQQFDLLLGRCSDCCGITMVQSSILYEINRSGTLSLIELADRVDLEKSTVSRHIQKLVEMGLVLRHPDTKDRRYIVLTLTPEGRNLEHRLSDALCEYIRQTFDSVPVRDLPAMSRQLQVISNAMKGSRFSFDNPDGFQPRPDAKRSTKGRKSAPPRSAGRSAPSAGDDCDVCQR
jgi:DNA-binding MarR family transcriptional regulator